MTMPPQRSFATGGIRWERLSSQGTAILRQVVVPIHLEGYSTGEVAKRLGIPPSSVRLLLELFETELRLIAQPEEPTDP